MTVFWRYATVRRQNARARGTGTRHEHDGGEPERDLTLERRIGKPGQLGGDEEHPASHRHEMEDAEQVVGGRVVGSLLVGVVEPVEASSGEPQRHGQEKDQDLRRVAHRVRLPFAGEEEQREHEGNREADHVRERQHAADQPAAARHERAALTAAQYVERTLVEQWADRIEKLGSSLRRQILL